MRSFKVLSIMVMLHWTIGQQVDSSVPDPVPYASNLGCVIRCWENTKYISKCAGDIACQCSEPNYQNSVFQCLYSQCDTAHFGSALHHAISQCFGMGNEIFFGIPPVPNRDSLRRREAEYAAGVKLYGSGSAAGFPTNSGYDYATQSAGNYPIQSAGNYPTQNANNYPTQSANYPTQSAEYPPTQSTGGPMSRSPPSPTPLYDPSYDPTQSNITTAATFNPLAESTTSAKPQIITNSSEKFARRAPLSFALLIILAALYLSI